MNVDNLSFLPVPKAVEKSKALFLSKKKTNNECENLLLIYMLFPINIIFIFILPGSC